MAGLTPATLGLLERAVGYGLCSLEVVTEDALTDPTPCAGWDLRTLLGHVQESLAILRAGLDAGCVDLEPPAPAGLPADRAEDLVGGFRRAAEELLETWQATKAAEPVRVGEHRLEPATLELVGAIEIAVHGWDVARACGQRRPIPPRLAQELLVLASLLVRRADRPARFAPPVRPAPEATPSDHLLAFLGRQPD